MKLIHFGVVAGLAVVLTQTVMAIDLDCGPLKLQGGSGHLIIVVPPNGEIICRLLSAFTLIVKSRLWITESAPLALLATI